MPGRQLPTTTETAAEAMRAGLAIMAIVLLARANVGAMTRNPTVWMELIVGLLVWSLAAIAVRWARQAAAGPIDCWRDCLAPALIILIVGGRGSSTQLGVAIGLIMIGILGVVSAAVWRKRNFDDQLKSCEEASRPHSVSATALSVGSFASERFGELAASAGPLTNPDLTAESDESPTLKPTVEFESTSAEGSFEEETPAAESWSRRESDGEVSIEAVILARFEEGAKLAVVHLPFMPPLPAVPQIECEPLGSGCEVTIKTEAAYRHGARLSITRRAAGPAESVPIGVVVYTSAEEQVES